MSKLQKISFLIGFIFIFKGLIAQNTDSSKIINLNEILIFEKVKKNGVERLSEVEGTLIYSGKKNEVIQVSSLDADLSVNNARQIFSKVPGVTIWENDGSGIQTSVSTRGLSPNRSWEFNVRQNGYDISSEVFGYPEAYFSPPSEALERIEVIRGAASLQFGPQFGGLLNYIIKKGDTKKPIVFETQQTAGSYGLFNSYNALGGTYKKITYYTYYHHRSAEGWRENSKYETNTGYIAMDYSVTSKLKIRFDYTRMDYRSQQPGGLTDSMFLVNNRQSKRFRNWMVIPWNVASLNIDFNINDNSKLTVKAFGTFSERKSVGYMKGIYIADTFNTSIKSYNLRQIDKDIYQNIGTEIRFLQSYKLMNQKGALAIGVRAYIGNTIRRQFGIGSGNNEADFSIVKLSNGKEWERELTFWTENFAIFAENMFKIGRRLSITPGVRYEIIKSSAKGYINSSATGNINDLKSGRNVLLFGCGLEFKATDATNIYANISNSYRPVTFSELTPSSTTEVIDPNLKDASGYNIDFGYRGNIKQFLNFDIGGFYLQYKNRIGTITKDNLPYRTNIGTSLSRGIEALIELDPISLIAPNSKIGFATLFASYSYINATYTDWNNPIIENDPIKSIKNKRVENAPNHTGRYGITYRLNQLSITYQFNHISDIYTDASNTELPNITSTIGKIKGYNVMDISLSYLLNKKYSFKVGVNNIADEKYATRRAGGYPGPGLLPTNGRTLFISIGGKF